MPADTPSLTSDLDRGRIHGARDGEGTLSGHLSARGECCAARRSYALWAHDATQSKNNPAASALRTCRRRGLRFLQVFFPLIGFLFDLHAI